MDNENHEHFYEANNNNDESTDEQPRENITDNKHIDALTLELFMNKSMYNRYVGRTNPKKYEEQQEFLRKLNRYKYQILKLTNDLVENPDKQITTDVNDMFNTYVKELLRYFEMKDIEMPTKNGNDEDMMFNPDTMDNKESSRPVTSYWGKEKVIRSGYPMNSFPRSRKF